MTMSTETSLPSAPRDFRRASEADDVEGMLDALAADAVLRSPIAADLRFEGRHELSALFTATQDAYQDITYIADFGDDRWHTLVFSARIGRQRFEETLVLKLDEQGRIAELTPSIRPMPGVAAVASAVGRRLARRHGRPHAVALRALTAPLVAMTRSGDSLGPRLVKPPRRDQ